MKKKKLTRQERREHGRNKLQKEIDKIVTIVPDPYLRVIEAKYSPPPTPPVCPNCGQSTRGNRMNGLPYCFTCRQTVKPNEKKSPRVRLLNKDDALRQDLKRLNPGLDPR